MNNYFKASLFSGIKNAGVVLCGMFIILAAVVVSPNKSYAATEKCAFSRDLDLGAEGEDVKCLQKFLNDSSFVIAATGVGSPGHETGQLKGLTQQAIINWQKANGILPATGYFGTKSRLKYAEIVKNMSVQSAPVGAATATKGTPSAVSAVSGSGKSIEVLNKELADLLKQANSLKSPVASTPGTATGVSANVNANNSSNTSTKNTTGNNPVVTVSYANTDAATAIKDAIKNLDDAKAQIKKSAKSGGNVQKATDELSSAREDFISAVSSYFINDFQKSIERARDALHGASDAFEAAGGVSKENKADSLISDVDDRIDQVKDQIHDADRKGDDVEDAQKLLDRARSLIAQAKKAFDADKFADAQTLAEKADDTVTDAIDAIGNDNKNRADDAISAAQDIIDDVRDLIKKGKNRGDDVAAAERLYNKAVTLLHNAENQFDAKNYADALSSAKDAKSMANDAKDEL